LRLSLAIAKSPTQQIFKLINDWLPEPGRTMSYLLSAD
jgi:hypothetical protein